MDRCLRHVLHWLVAACGASMGCHFRGADGPVPRSLVLSRQLSQQGVSAMEHGNWVRADELLAQAVKVFPQDAEARFHYAEALWHRRQQAAALEQLDKALQLSPDDPELLVRAAQMRTALGQAAEAGELIERALDVDPKNAAVWSLRGRLRRDAGEPREALADYHRALGYRPDDRETLLDVAEVYRQLNQPQRALATLQTLSETYPPGEEPAQVFYLTGLAYDALGRCAEAADLLALARDRGPPAVETLYRLAEAQWKAGRETEARQTTAQLLAVSPGHPGGMALVERLDVAQRPRPQLR
ncbi:MAG TPA: tetratricopeptide repeat protein [Pirellulales bacterium]|nr:tetratricopeptide repeat protein [Pirellulales bacterium]